jgi:hypothetical protein
MKIINHFRGIYEYTLNYSISVRSQCDRLDLGAIGSWRIMPKNVLRHWGPQWSSVSGRRNLLMTFCPFCSNVSLTVSFCCLPWFSFWISNSGIPLDPQMWLFMEFINLSCWCYEFSVQIMGAINDHLDPPIVRIIDPRILKEFISS